MSVRSLQRTVKAGKLTVTYKRGESGKQEASFDPDEIARYKQEMEAETVKPAITALEATTRDTALARIDAPQFFNALQQLVADGAKATNHSYAQVAIESKPLLKLDEARKTNRTFTPDTTRSNKHREVKSKDSWQGVAH